MSQNVQRGGRIALVCVVMSFAASPAWGLSFDTELVPGPVAYSVLLPDDYERSGATYPLFFFLHGGGGDNGFLDRMAPVFKDMWRKDEAPKMVVVTPSCGRSFYRRGR